MSFPRMSGNAVSWHTHPLGHYLPKRTAGLLYEYQRSSWNMVMEGYAIEQEPHDDAPPIHATTAYLSI